MRDLQDMTILVMDDEKVTLSFLSGILKRAGYHNVITADSGEMGLELLNDHQPDLILQDIMMPGMDGFEFCRQVRANEANRHIPIIVMTALSEGDAINRSVDAGATDFVGKPIHPVELLPRIRSGLTLKQSFDRLEEGLIKHKQTEEALRDSETRVRAITDSAQDAILMMDQEGMITYWNPAAERILGYTIEDTIGRNLHRLIAPQRYHAAHQAAFLRFQETGRGEAVGKTVELVARRKDGEEIPVELSLSSVFINGWQAVGVLRNIAERKRMEEALLESLNKYRKIFQNVQDVFYQSDANGYLIEISPSIQRYSGYTREELIGKPVADVYYNSEDRIRLLESMHRTGEVVDYEVRMKTKDDSRIYVSVNAQFLYDSTGKPTGVEGSLRDVTERKLAQDALKETE